MIKNIFIFSIAVHLLINFSSASANCNNEKHILLSFWIPIKLMESFNIQDIKPTLHWKDQLNNEGEFHSLELPNNEPLIEAALWTLKNKAQSNIEWYVVAWPSENNDSMFFDDKRDQSIIKLNSGLDDGQNGFDSYFIRDDLFSGSFPTIKPIGCGFNLLGAEL